MYDAQLGRWHVIDPLTETQESTDPDGREPDDDPPGATRTIKNFVLGFLAASLDNATVGISNPRQVIGAHATDAKAFNLGQDAADVADMIKGALVATGGTITEGVPVVLAPETAGLTGLLVPAGEAARVYGAATSAHAGASLITQKGRLNAEGNAGGSNNGKGNQPKKSEKRNRVADQKPGEAALNQLDGIGKAQNNAQKAVKGQNQDK